MNRIHVIGAGLAGLSTAVTLARAGHHVVLSEASNQAGGRCRSYHDPQLDTVIDNGNHLLLSGNHAALAYVEAIGATDKLIGPDRALFHFVDLADDTRWTLRPNDGALPWWVLKGSQRVPGTKLGDYMHARALLKPAKGATVGQTFAPQGQLWRRLIEPFLLATLNTPPADASAKLAKAVLKETLLKGGRALRPRIAQPTLSAASPRYAEGTPAVDTIAAVVALDYVDFRFPKAAWMPELPALRELAAQLAPRTSFEVSKPRA